MRLTLAGNVVLSIVIPSHSYGLTWTDDEKCAFDTAHLAKIDLSDEIFVLDVGGYVGDSTAREIAYAGSKGKAIRYLSAECQGWIEADCLYGRAHTA